MRPNIALLLLVAIFGSASKASAGVVITYDNTLGQVYDGEATFNSDHTDTGGVIAVATLPGYSSTVTSVFNPASMSGTFVQSRSGTANSYTLGQVSSNFTTDANVSYTVGGALRIRPATRNSIVTYTTLRLVL